MKHKVFVYGSLRRYGALNFYLESSKFLDEKKTKREFSLFSLGPFPAMVAHGKTAITGEVYEVSSSVLAHLDQAEGHPHLYMRTTIRLEDETEVFAYLFPGIPLGAKLVQSGDWLDYITS